MKAIKIEKVNYFGQETGTDDFNAKALYTKNGKLYLAHIYIDFFNKRVHEGRNNPREHKALVGFMQEINEMGHNTNFRFD